MSTKKTFVPFLSGFVLAALILLVTGSVLKYYYEDDWFATSPQATELANLQEQNSHPLYYSSESIWVEVEESPATFMDLFGELNPDMPEYNIQILDKLLAQTEECGTTVNQEELAAKIESLWGAQVNQYSFIPSDSGESEAWLVTLVRHDGLYEDVESFKADFNVCAAGSTMNPVRMNKDWLMFVSSCSAAYAEEPTGNTCSDVRAAIESTLEFN